MSKAWQHAELIEDTNMHMLEKEILCDVKFVVGEEKQEIKCHKYVLASRSPVFYTMFCGSLPEKDDDIVVPDIKPSIWKLFLQ